MHHQSFRAQRSGAEESIEKVIASTSPDSQKVCKRKWTSNVIAKEPKATVAISTSYFDIYCSPQDTLRWMFDIRYSSRYSRAGLSPLRKQGRDFFDKSLSKGSPLSRAVFNKIFKRLIIG